MNSVASVRCTSFDWGDHKWYRGRDVCAKLNLDLSPTITQLKLACPDYVQYFDDNHEVSFITEDAKRILEKLAKNRN